MRVALVTEELARGSGSGGIGGAFHELALLLVRQGHVVDLIFVPCTNRSDLRDVQQYYQAHGIKLLLPDLSEFIWDTGASVARAYAVFRYLESLTESYNIVHFHDYKGLGHFCIAGKKQGLALQDTVLVVQVHGPTRWTLQANGFSFSHEDQLKIDMMERLSVAGADVLVSPSRYMVEWLQQEGWTLPSTKHIHIIQNPLGALLTKVGNDARPVALESNAREIVLFARHEARKGIGEFCDALDILAPELADSGVQVTFLGPLGHINGEGSLVYLAGRAKYWSFPIAVLPDMGRDAAAAYLIAHKKALVVVPSPVENSPYTVLEAIALGKPLLTSNDGGARELLEPALVKMMTCRIAGRELAAAIRRVLAKGLIAPRLAVSPDETDRRWLALHETYKGSVALTRGVGQQVQSRPRVMVAITHHERPQKLFDALMSVARQTYENIEIVIVDDGSSNLTTSVALDQLQPLLDRLGARLIRQQNAYLGAARNTAARSTSSDYLLFLDDDDIAFPTLVSTLVAAAEATKAGVMGCINLFMEEARRHEAHPYPDEFKQRVSYVPLGGPLSLAPIDNSFGSATSLIRRSTFDRVGGYTEDKGVGHEDYEFYIRALQAGERVEVCPIPLYLYEVGRPSMVSRTSTLKSFQRVARAIDITRQLEQWRDLVSLNAGRRAIEHELNTRAYMNSISPFATHLQRLVQMNAADSAYATAVAELANALGADRFGHALMSLAARRLAFETNAGRPGEAVELCAGLDVPQERTTPDRVFDQHVLRALINLASGRTIDAVAAFNLSVERNRLLTNEQRRFLVELAAMPAAAPAELQPLLKALRLLRGFKWTDECLAPVLFRLLLRAGAGVLALAAYETVHSRDAELYMAANPDVRQYASDHDAALRHFQDFGRAEARSGFLTLLQLEAVLQEETGKPIELVTMREVIAAIGKGKVNSWSPQAQVLAAE